MTAHAFLLRCIFPPREAIEARIHQLCWTQHGGSGYTFSRRDILDMDLAEMDRYIDRARRARKEMASAIKKEQAKAAAAARRRGG